MRLDMQMKIPSLDLKKQVAPIRAEIDEAVKRVIDNSSFILGSEAGELESLVCSYLGIKYAVGVSNGTDAIRLALLASGIKPGDGVICPAFTYYATAGAVVSVGAVPVFADIDPAVYNISAERAEEILRRKKSKLRIKAVIPVHLYGQCADMDPILKISAKFGLKTIEDAAQAFGAEYKGRKAGTMSDCSATSFFPGKNLGAFGDAGMVMTGSARTDRILRILRNQGNEKKYIHTIIGYNNRMDSIQAAVLKIKLKYLDGWNRKRADNARYYNRRIEELGLDIKTPFVPEHNTHIYHQYCLRLPRSNRGLLRFLNEKGIDSRIFYPIPLHLQKCFKYLGYKKGDFPESEKACRQVLAIPVYPDLTQEEMDYIIATISEYMKAAE